MEKVHLVKGKNVKEKCEVKNGEGLVTKTEINEETR